VVPAPWRTPAGLLAAIRQGEPAALRALFVFYAPLLRDQARQMGVPEDERADLVTRVLDDFVLRVLDAGLAPYDLARYLVGATRNESRKDHRGRTRRRATDERAYTMLAHPDQRVVAECHSEYGLRSAMASEDAGDPASLRSAIIKLAQWSALALQPDELALMVGVSRHVPVRDLAAQAGISYGAARVRVHRLRERFRKLVVQYVASLDTGEQREVERFLRRAGVCLESRVERTGGTDDTV
jgi:DNA-binding Lrp family transcriptional regulator